MDNKNESVFKLNIDDFETVLGRELTDDEKLIVIRKFSIDEWSDIVDLFFEEHNIN